MSGAHDFNNPTSSCQRPPRPDYTRSTTLSAHKSPKHKPSRFFTRSRSKPEQSSTTSNPPESHSPALSQEALASPDSRWSRSASSISTVDRMPSHTDPINKARSSPNPYQTEGRNSSHITILHTLHTIINNNALAVPDRKYAASSAAAAEQRAHQRGDLSVRTSSTSGTGSSASAYTPLTSAEPSGVTIPQPFTWKDGRRHLRDQSLPYPFPCDIDELHRQTLKTMLLLQVFGGPVCNPKYREKPPARVLEMGCGTGVWSALCYQHYAKQGHTGISFTGMDIAPVAPDMNKAYGGMDWRFVQHDVRKLPLPFETNEFDFIMTRDAGQNVRTVGNWQQPLMDEYLRVLKPGGVLEIWDGDHVLRTLIPHTRHLDSYAEPELATASGVYEITHSTPLTAPQNQYIVDYNNWITKAYGQRHLAASSTPLVRSWLMQEPEDLISVQSRRLAIPLGEIRWEREGIGGNATPSLYREDFKDDAASLKGKGKETSRRFLNPEQRALRQTALMIFVQMIDSLEPLLKEVSGKGQDEWDRWQANMMNSLMKQNGASYGECLEVGAWWAMRSDKTS